jgi:hypothetical protein
MVIVPVDADIDEAEHVSKEMGRLCAYASPVELRRKLNLIEHQRQAHGNHPSLNDSSRLLLMVMAVLK